MKDILVDCGQCGGTGQESITTTDENGDPVVTQETCRKCLGAGSVITSVLDDLLPDDVFHSYIVFEATDLTEYSALSSGNKETYQLLLSFGQVNLADGSNAFDLLKSMFGPGSTTRANLLALLP